MPAADRSARFAAFLRGVNLGRNRRVSGEQLRTIFGELGFGAVASFLTSGNVVFDAASGDERALTGQIEAGLRDALGFEVVTFLRSAAELEAIAAAQPFDAPALAAAGGKPQVALLRTAPDAAAVRGVAAHDTPEDRLVVLGRELHWLPAAGVGMSTLDLDALAKLLGPMTVRTANTMQRLHAKFFAG